MQKWEFAVSHNFLEGYYLNRFKMGLISIYAVVFIGILTLECSQGALDPKTYFKADRSFIIRQRAVIKAFTHYRCPSLQEHDDFYLASQNYNPRLHLRDYSDSDRVDSYVTALESGKLLSRYEMFSFEATPLAEFKELVLILNNAWVKDANLFYKTLAYFSTRNNLLSLYTAVTIIVSSLRTEGYRLPPPYEAIPQFYTPKDIIHQANEIDLQKTTVTKTYIASRTGMSLPEEPLAYYRDDALLNTFHYLWHADFPSWYNQSAYPARKIRKGELFMNLHHNLIQRYFAERISLGFSAIPELDMALPLNPGFAPNMMNLDYQNFPTRGPGVYAKDLTLNANFVGVNNTRNTELDIRQGIRDGYLVASNGSQISVRNFEGSNVIGNSIESSVDSVNRARYGNYHNFGHLLISRVVDPDGKLKLPAGAILHQETSMMDPVFYQLHWQIDTLNKLQKDYLEPYTKSELDNPGILLKSISVQTVGKNVPKNELQTEFRNVSWDISNSIEEIDGKCSHVPRAQIFANVKQVNSKEFNYTLEISANRSTLGVVRIFMAPTESFDKGNPDVDTLRWSFFEMDKFPVNLTKGNNTITRLSKDNSLAPSQFVPIATLNEMIDKSYFLNTPLYANKYTRHCGWPKNYYLPIGRPEGMHYWIFAMVSDFAEDYTTDFDTAKRLVAESYCTVVDGPIPDKRAMGFPFDKKITSLPDFIQGNMHMVDVIVRHV